MATERITSVASRYNLLMLRVMHGVVVIVAWALSSGVFAAIDPPLAEGDDAPAEKGDVGRRAILAAANSGDWFLRALAAMRLEVRDDVDNDTILESLKADADWRVRAFAVRSIARRPDGDNRLSELTDRDPRVLRIALLYGAKPKARQVEAYTKRALTDSNFTTQIFGIEMAALSGDESLGRAAGRLLTVIIQTMNNGQASYLSSRLGRACGLSKGGSVKQWREWLASSNARFLDRVKPTPRTPRQSGTTAGDSDRAGDPDDVLISALPETDITRMTDEDFRQFIDYLGSLAMGKVEIVICVDASGSMGSSINAVKEGLDRMVGFLAKVTTHLRLGMVTYQNFNDPPVVLPLTTDVERVRAFLWGITVGGGSNEPVTFAIQAALERNRWTREALRMIILVGDEPYQQHMRPQLESMLGTAKSNGFMVHAVYPHPREFPPWNEVARWGGGRSISLRDTGELVALIVSLTVGSIWHDQIGDFMAAFAEIAP